MHGQWYWHCTTKERSYMSHNSIAHGSQYRSRVHAPVPPARINNTKYVMLSLRRAKEEEYLWI